MARTDVPSPIMIEYVIKGKGITYRIGDFFTRTKISVCTVTCNFGDNCGGTLNETYTSLIDLNET